MLDDGLVDCSYERWHVRCSVEPVSQTTYAQSHNHRHKTLHPFHRNRDQEHGHDLTPSRVTLQLGIRVIPQCEPKRETLLAPPQASLARRTAYIRTQSISSAPSQLALLRQELCSSARRMDWPLRLCSAPSIPCLHPDSLRGRFERWIVENSLRTSDTGYGTVSTAAHLNPCKPFTCVRFFTAYNTPPPPSAHRHSSRVCPSSEW